MISSGSSAKGQGGAGVPWITGGAGCIHKFEKLEMSSVTVCGAASGELCPLSRPVTKTSEALDINGFETEDGGKYFVLYF